MKFPHAFARSRPDSPLCVSFPAELWLLVIAYLPSKDLLRLRHLNSTFWQTFLDRRFDNFKLEVALNPLTDVTSLQEWERTLTFSQLVYRSSLSNSVTENHQ